MTWFVQVIILYDSNPLLSLFFIHHDPKLQALASVNILTDDRKSDFFPTPPYIQQRRTTSLVCPHHLLNTLLNYTGRQMIWNAEMSWCHSPQRRAEGDKCSPWYHSLVRQLQYKFTAVLRRADPPPHPPPQPVLLKLSKELTSELTRGASNKVHQWPN